MEKTEKNITVVLEFKKEDFAEDNYLMANECAITKALNRAGYSNLIDNGTGVSGKGLLGKDIPTNRKQYLELRSLVLEAYREPTKAQDFTFALEFFKNVDLQKYV